MENSCFAMLKGGLCNQMFIIAAAYAHSKRHRYDLKIGPSKYMQTIFHKCKQYLGSPDNRARVWKEPVFRYVPIPSHCRILLGYFQSSCHFADVSGEIRDLFDPPTSLKEAVTAKHAGLLTPTVQERGVVIHIRRGDYMIGANKSQHGILDERYYQRAIEAARAAVPDCQLLVFSDDLPWCREQPWLACATFVEEPVDVQALWLMSRFRHFILSNSTFGWWAAWLAGVGTRVWAPDRWFGTRDPIETRDIYEPNWVQLPIT